MTLRCHIEACVGFDRAGVLIAGWVVEPHGVVGRMTLVVDGSPAVEVGVNAVRFELPDVRGSLSSNDASSLDHPKLGFVAFAKTDWRADTDATHRLVLSARQGDALEVELAPDAFDSALFVERSAYLRQVREPVLALLASCALTDISPVRAFTEALNSHVIDRVHPAETSSTISVDACLGRRGEGLLLDAKIEARVEEIASVWLIAEGTRAPINISPYLSYQLEIAPPNGARFLAAVPQAHLFGMPRRVSLSVRLNGGSVLKATPTVESDPYFVRAQLTALDPDACISVAELARSNWSESANQPDTLRGEVLSIAAAAVARLPVIFEAPSDHQTAAAIDHVFYVPGRGMLVVGWLLDFAERWSRLDVCWGNGRSVEILGRLSRQQRPDLRIAYPEWSRRWPGDRFGFAAFVEMPDTSCAELARSLYFRLETRSHEVRRLRSLSVWSARSEPLTTIREIIRAVPLDGTDVLFSHVGPTIEGLWDARAPRSNDMSVLEIGKNPDAADTSVIVPIYGRFDFIEYQLSLFADDADLHRNELIYVIDDPQIAVEAVRMCRERFPLFRVPMRVIVCRGNNGYAAANNVGASIARGRLLVLLNSDVMPKAPGWLSALQRVHDALRDPGPIGPKLLYHDGAVQHGGMGFEQPSDLPGLWMNAHPGKGIPSLEPDPVRPVAVPAVSGACLMVDGRSYRDVGGLDEGYILGDFEDSDLCLKFRKLGRRSFYVPQVELYHLERQSVALSGPDDWRTSLTLYNAWRHTKKWNDVIQESVREARV